MADVNIESLKAQRAELTGKILDIEAQQAEHFRLWSVEGVTTSGAVRATLAADRAALRTERHRVSVALEEAKQAYAEGRRADHLAALVLLLTRMGLAHLVAEAKTQAEQAAA
jgi:protein-disulfide isomerase-like protein with CxxC motif